ncbi:MAG: DUF111 family protein [Deltaproteobacteria bacterium]|nr:DUF111 family protein [Deltaproteobacteria bacterium]
MKKDLTKGIFEANVDDMNPQFFDYCMELLFKAGAVDVFLERIQMKKNRPGFLLKAIAPWNKREKIIAVILRETTTLGVRYHRIDRVVLTRKMKIVSTKAGKVPVKIATDQKLKIKKFIPEYEICRQIAKKKNLPLREVYESVIRACHNQN